MEGVGARFGRSSTRYTPATVFTGPVRKWKKTWVQSTPSATTHHRHSATNGGSRRSSHLLMYKWTPITSSTETDGNNNSDDAEAGGSDKDDEAFSIKEPPNKKIKFIPVVAFEEQKNEDEAKPIEIDVNTAETTSEREDAKPPDINNTPMEETQAIESDPKEHHDLNRSTLDLSLGLKALDSENESLKPKTDPVDNEVQQD